MFRPIIKLDFLFKTYPWIGLNLTTKQRFSTVIHPGVPNKPFWLVSLFNGYVICRYIDGANKRCSLDKCKAPLHTSGPRGKGKGSKGITGCDAIAIACTSSCNSCICTKRLIARWFGKWQVHEFIDNTYVKLAHCLLTVFSLKPVHVAHGTSGLRACARCVMFRGRNRNRPWRSGHERSGHKRNTSDYPTRWHVISIIIWEHGTLFFSFTILPYITVLIYCWFLRFRRAKWACCYTCFHHFYSLWFVRYFVSSRLVGCNICKFQIIL